MYLQLMNNSLLSVPRDHLEKEVARRINTHPRGEPGITPGPRTGDGQHEFVMRDRHGEPIGVLSYTGPVIADFAVRADRRMMGVGTAMVRHACERHGCQAIRGPFTEDGMAFAKKVSA